MSMRIKLIWQMNINECVCECLAPSSWHLASVAHKGLTTGEQFAQALTADDRDEGRRGGEIIQ